VRRFGRDQFIQIALTCEINEQIFKFQTSVHLHCAATDRACRSGVSESGFLLFMYRDNNFQAHIHTHSHTYNLQYFMHEKLSNFSRFFYHSF
jgi:hypothetical protein